MVQKPVVISIAIADAAATGHANAGFALVRQINEIIAAKTQGGADIDYQQLLSLVIPAATNMAFAVELFLKIHEFQIRGTYPEGHDLAQLGRRFDAVRMEGLRQIYKRFMAAPEFQNGFVLDVAGAQKGDDLVPPKGTGNPQSYDEAIVEAGRAFEQWRYIYERFGAAAFRERISLPTLWILVQTLKQAIRDFQGPVKVTANWQTGQRET